MKTANPLFGDKVQKDAARRRYDTLVDAVTRVINEADPMGLLALECPLDEYSPEVGTIVPRVVKASSPDEVKSMLFEEFDRWFGEGSVPRVATFDVPAQAIWQAVLDWHVSSA
jgi:hypothetical protein